MAVGASAGALNPKTHHKWVWAFIVAVANLVDIVVSNSQHEDITDYSVFDDDAL